MTQNRPPLVRDTQNKVIGGVCSGIANYFGWDVSVVRIITALCLVFAGSPILIYLIMWAVIPSDVSVYGTRLATPEEAYQSGYQRGWQQGYQENHPEN